jgi:hypothetical protein
LQNRKKSARRHWKLPTRFLNNPTLEKVIGALNDAIEWHQGCEVRCVYGTYPMIVDTVLWISMADLSEDKMFDLYGLLRKPYYEALGGGDENRRRGVGHGRQDWP